MSAAAAQTQPPPPISTFSSSTTRYKLAEHRYGREEMLALFEEPTVIPDDLKDTSIFSIKELPPLAFIPVSQEEQVRVF